MPYSTNKKEIRAGFVNFIGALLEASQLPDIAARHDIVAVLCEEMLRLAQDKEGYNNYILKPLFKVNILLLQDWIKELTTTLETTSLTPQLTEEFQHILSIYCKMEYLYKQIVEKASAKTNETKYS